MENYNNKGKEEYLMLRDEILHLDSLTNNTINFFYTFIVAYIAFALTQEDTIFIILSYIGIIPPYLIVLNKMNALCKIGAYLNVFHEYEGGDFQWERRHMKYKDKYESNIFRVISWHFPFLCINFLIIVLFIYKTNWKNITITDGIKGIICIILFLIILCKTVKNRNISPRNYIHKWKSLKIK